MNIDEMRSRLFELMSTPAFMPLRKRGLAKQLDVSDEDYRAFRSLVEEMAEKGEIAELKRGKYGLPLGSESTAPASADASTDGLRKKQKFAPPARRDSDEDDGDDAENRGGKRKEKFDLPKNARTGRIDIKKGGMGFLLSDPPGNDLFISEDDLGGALSGDLVAVEFKKRKTFGRRGGGMSHSRPAARVIRVLERARLRLIGTFFSYRRANDPRGPIGHVIPDTRGVFAELDVLGPDRNGAKDHDKVAIELVEADESHRSGQRPTARIVKIFGQAGEAAADIDAILENFNVRKDFPADALEEAEQVSEEIPESELAQRTDYTEPITFTIDPSDAKDHDDAVAIRTEADGRTTLLVHIADVSYYVREGSPIDVEGRERATSVYLPGKVYPMLPPRLSNNMCSLREGQVRLTKTVSMTFSKNLSMQEVKIERSFIKSAAFLTYNEVRDGLEQQKPELVRSQKIYDTLVQMREFAGALRKKRLASGSLNLDLPESKLLLDEKGEVKGWAKEEHHWAHELIEDMMLAANRAVAEYLIEHELPGLFRTHEEPDPEALERFAEFIREFGISIRPPLDRMKLKSVLERVEGKDIAHTIHMALLTSMKQARYTAECSPHYALNFNRYLHFTSPIRRYPDLIVHRALDSRFEPGMKALPAHGKKRKGGDESREYYERISFLQSLATHCSRKERDAAACEQDVIKFRQMQFLRRNLKEEHPGIITGVRDFGIFVELQDCLVEGLIRVQDLTDDYYEYFENQHMLQGRGTLRSFRLGDKVSVKVVNIDLARKQVNLEIL